MAEVRIYLNTTPDVTLERDELLSQVIAGYQQKCKDKNITFKVIELHPSGHPNCIPPLHYYENVEVAFCEMDACKEEGVYGCFIYILGNDEGIPMLPTEIESQTFQVIKSFLAADQVSQVEEIYKRDRNLLPEAFVLDLQSSCINDMKPTEAWQKLEEAREFLEIAFREALENGLVPQEAFNYLFNSDIQLECLVCMDTLPKEKRLCIKRTLLHPEPAPSSQNSSANSDTVSIKDIYLEKLQERDPKSVIEMKVVGEKVDASNTSHSSYLKELCCHVDDLVGRLVNEACEKLDLKPEVKCESDCIPKFRQEETFNSIKAKLFTAGKSIKPLLIHGVSGSGKTTIIEDLTASAPDWFGDDYVVLHHDLRNKDEGCIVDLMNSMCKVLRNDECNRNPAHNVHTASASLKKCCLEKRSKAVLIILDHLESIQQCHGAHSLQWIPSNMSQNVKMILSLCTDSRKGKNILENAQRIIHDPARIYNIDSFSRVSGSEMILQSLKKSGKALRTHQYEAIFSSFPLCQSPLFVELALAMSSHWHSFRPGEEYNYPGDIKEVINEFFDMLEQKLGTAFVTWSIGFIAGSKKGITEDELRDLLTLECDLEDYTVNGNLADIYVKRLLYELRHFIFYTISCEGCPVIVWKSAVFRECARKRFLSSSDGTKIHCSFVKYYEKMSDTKILENMHIDRRLIVNLPYHLAHAQETEKVLEMILDIQWWIEYLKLKSPCTFAKDIRVLVGKVSIVDKMDLRSLETVLSRCGITAENCCEKVLALIPCSPGYADNSLLHRLVSSAKHDAQHSTIPQLCAEKGCTVLPFLKLDTLCYSGVVAFTDSQILIGKGNTVKQYAFGNSNDSFQLIRSKVVGAGLEIETITTEGDNFMVVCKLSTGEDMEKKVSSWTKMIKVFRISSGESVYSGDGMMGILPHKAEWHGIIYSDKAVIFQDKKRLASLLFPSVDAKVSDVVVSMDDSLIVIMYKSGLCCAYDLKGSQVWNVDTKKLLSNKLQKASAKADSNKKTTNGSHIQNKSLESEKENVVKIDCIDIGNANFLAEERNATQNQRDQTSERLLTDVTANHDSLQREKTFSCAKVSHLNGICCNYLIRVDSQPSCPIVHLVSLMSGKHQSKRLAGMSTVLRIICQKDNDTVVFVGKDDKELTKSFVCNLPSMKSVFEFAYPVVQASILHNSSGIVVACEKRLVVWQKDSSQLLKCVLPNDECIGHLQLKQEHVLVVGKTVIDIYSHQGIDKIKHQGPLCREIHQANLTPDESCLVVVDTSGSLAEFNIDSSKWSTSVNVNCHPEEITLLSVTNDLILTCAGNTLCLWKKGNNIQHIKTIHLQFDPKEGFFSKKMNSFTVFQGSNMAVVSLDGKVKYQNLPESSMILSSKSGDNFVLIDSKHSGAFRYSLSEDEWSCTTLHLVPGALVESIVFSCDDSVFLVKTSGDNAVTVFDTKTSTSTASVESPVGGEFLLSSDPRRIAIYNRTEGKLTIWKLENKSIAHILTMDIISNLDFCCINSANIIIGLKWCGNHATIHTYSEEVKIATFNAELALDFPIVFAKFLCDNQRCVILCTNGISDVNPLILTANVSLHNLLQNEKGALQRNGVMAGDGAKLKLEQKKSKMCTIL